MCRLALKSAATPFSPYTVLQAMESMQEGYDGSGLGLLLRGVEFADFNYQKGDPILSGVAHTKDALDRLNAYMQEKGFTKKYDHEFETDLSELEVADRHKYFVRVYRIPKSWDMYSQSRIGEELMLMRLYLRKDGESHGGDLSVFSIWPDVVMIKEIGWPLAVGNALSLDDDRIKARIVMAQGRQNTNWGINLHACHPFFIQGIATMTNGENTAFQTNREWLEGRQFPGYVGYQSDSEVFAHILHYVYHQLKLPLALYKHVITPLSLSDLNNHPQGEFLKGLKNVCRDLVIDGPNCVIGTLADETTFMVMDQKKLRPGCIGGKPGEWAMASEICGVDAMIPDRDPSLDFQPMRENTVVIPSHREQYEVWSQFDEF
ncbi:MAG: glutamate synthase [Desulfobulbaceae bacterium]|uniref:Glutamate synthase n=1 Tax=Candidatus Desulfobia pelagia TaxID=2841692 RepID=A0A8J6NFB3_9BACT|nr:glutamate synthase [Candidatus Desulfobia pelagia]